MPSLFAELKRRNVIRVSLAYIVMSWLLVQVLELAADAFGAPDWTLKLVITGLVLGLLPAVVFSWVYELTPEGVRKESEIERDQSITTHTARKLDVTVVVLLVVAMGLFIADRVLPERKLPNQPMAANAEPAAASDQQANSVAVLPFVDLSPAGDQAYFSDGIAEEILNVLVRVDALSVASRTSSFQFKDRDLGIPDIARNLKVRHILEGSVRKAGDTLRITAQLIDTANDRHLWSQTYDRALTAENIFEIQDEIAKAIVQALSQALGIEAAAPVEIAVATENLSAYELYLQAKPLFQSRTRLLDADAMLSRAIELDAEFVEALELRAGVLTVMYEYEPQSDDAQNLQAARALIEQILELDPRRAAAYAVRGNLNWGETLTGSGNWQLWESILADYKHAISLDPKSTEAQNWVGLAWNALGFLDKALDHFQTCLGIDPLYRPCAENRVVMLAALGRDKDAMTALLADFGKGISNPIWTPPDLLARQDEELLFKAIANSPDVLLGWPRIDELYAAFRSGRPHPALARDAVRFVQSKGKVPEAQLALMFQSLGAYELTPMALYMWDAGYADYRQSRQFANYLRATGTLSYWREHGFPPQCRAVGTDGFACD